MRYPGTTSSVGRPWLLRATAAAIIVLGAASSPAQNPARPAGYAGSDACQVCHDDLSKAFGKNPHHAVETGSKPAWKGLACEACHGPGAKHAESASAADIVNPAKQPAAKTDEICLKCHLNQPTHAGRLRSSHVKNQVSCTNCHTMHQGPEKLRPTQAGDINRKCAACHNAVWASFQRPYKHRLPEGAMSCTDCHNPHGSSLPRSIRMVDANEPSCLRCHSDLRGPFAFEHAPVRLEGCTTCHEPHGSANPRMLTRREVRFLCLECHANIAAGTSLGGVPPAFHDLRSTRYQNCTICHSKVHGSYVDAYLER